MKKTSRKLNLHKKTVCNLAQQQILGGINYTNIKICWTKPALCNTTQVSACTACYSCIECAPL